MNEEKFTGKASIYKKYRPAYPEAFINYLYSEVGFNPTSIIADIGAGTGILSRLLVSRGSSVICVEPNSSMLEAAKQELGGFTNCSFTAATAEHTTLDDNSVDFITVAQAFHWFDRVKFKAECNRILKNKGKVVLVWNNRDRTARLTIENGEINRRFCPEFKGFSGGIDEDPVAYADFFKNGTCEFKSFNNDLVFDEEGFIGRCLSGSYAPKKDSACYHDYVGEIRKLFKRHCKSGLLLVSNTTKCYVNEV